MKPGDLVRLRGSSKKNVGIVLHTRRSVTDFHDSAGLEPYIYAEILWDEMPFEFMKMAKGGKMLELSEPLLEVISEAG